MLGVVGTVRDREAGDCGGGGIRDCGWWKEWMGGDGCGCNVGIDNM